MTSCLTGLFSDCKMGYFVLNELERVSTARMLLVCFCKIELLARLRSALMLGFCAVFATFAAVRFGSMRFVPSVFVYVYYLRIAPLILQALSGDS